MTDEREISRGISREKTRESLGVFIMIAVVIAAMVAGSKWGTFPALATLFGGMIWAWTVYRG